MAPTTAETPATPPPVQAVSKPILCSPYHEPDEHWVYSAEGAPPERVPGRRPASYFFTTRRTGSTQMELLAEENRDELELVNLLRADVKRWREAGYPGAEQVTRTLLRHWASADLPRRLFYCQRESAETIIYLREILEAGKTLPWRKLNLTREDYAKLIAGERPDFVEGEEVWYPRLTDSPAQGPDLVRLGCKMATGSGKTVVMAMLIAWSFCNRGRRRADRRFADAVLVVCPNLTVKERLQVLRPDMRGNYYEAFDLVPSSLLTELRKGRVLVENWHRFLPESPHAEAGSNYTVVNKGEEGAEAFGRRVLGDLYDRGPIMVLNDEAHHAYRPAPPAEDEKVGREEKKEREDATIWVGGLDRLNAGAGISFCVDLSATPFYLSGSGHIEGSPHPWLVSDFGLVDAIESGIVKIPRLPVADQSGHPEPKYYALWRNITADLKRGEKIGSRPKPEVIWREAQDALLTLAAQWKTQFEQLQEATGPGVDRTPPVLIIVCDSTNTAEIFFRKISGEEVQDVDDLDEDEEEELADRDEAAPRRRLGKKKVIRYGTGEVFPELLSNTADEPLRTIRIDSKLLEEAETRLERSSRMDAAERLREIGASGVQADAPGEQVRCVISVQMLSEGWDANNVTHILGLRAFGSQLLCEQVVGRGLRRMDYVPDPETGLLTEEYVDVYGVPFSLLPFRGTDPKRPPVDPPPQKHVRALPERAHLAIRFPVVESYAFSLKRNAIRADVDAIPALKLDPVEAPQAVFVKPQVGTGGKPGLGGGFEMEKQSREAYYESTHLQTIQFEIAREVVRRLLQAQEDGGGRPAAHQLFPQAFRIVQEYTERRVDYRGCDPREIGLDRYAGEIANRLFTAIRPDDAAGERRLLPLLNRYHPVLDSGAVDFKTVKPCYETARSHVNLVAGDTKSWEQATAFSLEASDHVECYVRNDHLGLHIPYEYNRLPRTYVPDFLVRLKDGTHLVLEVKGHEREEDREKHTAAERWAEAVTNWGKLGPWSFAVCRDPQQFDMLLTDPLAAAS